ncbi:hypothetical protein ABZY90_38060 [Streptomyces sp. NPDC006422]|uniref:hypothetical protein n=1 Tax=unclassified Streptomyces TaxID=2593676 RepID=UPI0033AA3A38
MDAELTALAAAGATALVQQMTTDAWTRVRDRVARIVSRGRGAEEGAVAGELEESRGDVAEAREAGDEEAVGAVEGAWRYRMRQALRANPEAAAELREILAELDQGGAAAPTVTYHVHNNISGGSHGFTVQAGSVGRVERGPRA